MQTVNHFSTRRVVIFSALAGALVSLAATSSESLWIDEGLTATKAIQPTLAGWWKELMEERNTNMTMLLYLVWVWAWEKLFGASEFALRAANVPFIAMASGCLAWCGARLGKFVGPAAVLLFLSSPFTWFYANEARTYAMLMGLGALSLAFIVAYDERGRAGDFRFRGWLTGLCLTLAVIPWVHVVGITWVMGITGYLAWHHGRELLPQLWREGKAPILLLAAITVALMLYVRWTQHIGASANAIGKTTLITIAFWVYEFFGFQGFGPGRSELRTSAVSIFKPFIMSLGLIGLAWAGTAVSSWRQATGDQRKQCVRVGVLLVAVPLALLFAVGVAKGIRLLPRYAAPSFPAFCLLSGLLLAQLWNSRAWTRWLATLLPLALLGSALTLRMAERHQKDDYQAAAREAQAAIQSGAVVFWGADRQTGHYYGVPGLWPLDTKHPQVQPADVPADFGRTALLILSKPDIYDASGAARTAATSMELFTNYASFSLWRRATVPQP